MLVVIPRLSLPLKAIILFYTISPLIYLVRAIFGDTGGTSVLLRTLEPALILVMLYSIVQAKLVRVSYPVLLLICIGAYGVFVGFMQGNAIVDIIAGLTHFCLGLLLFIYFSVKDVSTSLNYFFKRLSFFSTMVISFVIMAIYALPLLGGPNVYLGLACQVLIVVFFYNFANKRLLYCLFILALIFLSGKRGILVALVVSCIIMYIPYFLVKHRQLTVRATLLLTIVGGVFVWSSPAFLDRTLSKFQFNEETNLNAYSSGRLDEALSAIEFWQSSDDKIKWGAGFGFTYEYIHQKDDLTSVENYKNIHFSYLNPLVTFGVIVATLYFAILLWLFMKSMRFKNSQLAYLKLAVFTHLIYACFVFNLFNEPILWMALGILCNPKTPRSYQKPTNSGLQQCR